MLRRAANGDSLRLDMSYHPTHGGLQTLTDPARQSWGFAYDERKLLSTRTDPLHQVSRIGHDAAGQVDTLSDPLGNTLGLDYDLERAMPKQKAPHAATFGQRLVALRKAATLHATRTRR